MFQTIQFVLYIEILVSHDRVAAKKQNKQQQKKTQRQSRD